MRRATTAAVALATTSALSITMLAGAFGAAQATTGAADRGHSHAKAHFVDFALKGAGFGSRANGGQVPTGSDQTAFMAVGCATRVPIDKENHEAEATIPGLGKTSNVKTDIWTRQKDGAVSTYTSSNAGSGARPAVTRSR